MTTKQELTGRAITVGVVLSLAMAAANMYLAIRTGMTISANIPCSVIALILFHTIWRARSLPEVNIVQATGSTGEGMAAGVVFVFPALALAGAMPAFNQWGLAEYAVVAIAVLAGSVLGVVLTGFLRKPMVTESKELKFPEGVATAEILKAGWAAFSQGKREGVAEVALAFFGGMAVKLLSSLVAVFQETTARAFTIGNAAFKIGADVSAALVGVGFIIEFNGAVLVAAGGALAWLVFIPIYTALHPMPGDASDLVEAAKEQVKFIGVGGMIVGGMWSIVRINKQLVKGIRAGMAGFRGTGTGAANDDPSERDLPRGVILAMIALGVALALAVYVASAGAVGAAVSLLYTVLATFIFVAISVYIVGLIGSTNQPVSGITICTFLLAALFLLAGQVAGPEGIRMVLLVSGLVCLAACLSGTAGQNFKTAQLVGGTPAAVQTGLLIATVPTAILSAPLLAFLLSVPGTTPPPQPVMFSEMANTLFGQGTLPWNMVGIGAGLAVVLILVGLILERRGSSFGISPMAVAVGIYLPFTTTLPILLGGLAHLAVTIKERDDERLKAAIQAGTVLCASLVAGEAITGIFVALPKGLGADLPWVLMPCDYVRDILSVGVLAMMPILIYTGARKKM